MGLSYRIVASTAHAELSVFFNLMTKNIMATEPTEGHGKQ